MIRVTKDLRFFVGGSELPRNFISLGNYTKTAPVKALKINDEFAVEDSSGDLVLSGHPGDYLVVESGTPSVVPAEDFGKFYR
jgi:hypothetical protein